jgi:hypothetical protein
MPPSPIIFNAFYSLLALLSIALIAREGVSRLGAGPVRFRLGIASRADSRQVSAAHSSGWILTVCGFLFLFPIFRVFPDSWQHFMPWLWPVLWLCVCTLSLGSPRRDAKSWLVLAAGLLSLVNGAALLAVGLRTRFIRFSRATDLKEPDDELWFITAALTPRLFSARTSSCTVRDRGPFGLSWQVFSTRSRSTMGSSPARKLPRDARRDRPSSVLGASDPLPRGSTTTPVRQRRATSS